MIDGSMDTRAENGVEWRPKGTVAVLLAVLTFIGFLLLRAPTVVVLTVGFFDEGLQLASGTFAGKGLIAFRDYYVPYGPANAYLLAALRLLGLDSIIFSRALFLLLNGAVAGLGTYLLLRRRGFFAAAVFAGLAIAVPPSPSYTGVVLLMIAAFLTAIGWRVGPLKRPLVEQSSTTDNMRLLIVGVLLAFAVWFRWEFVVVLAVWCGLILQRSGLSMAVRARLTAVPLALASAPYVAIVVLGGGVNLFRAIEYAVFVYPRYRGLPFPFAAPWKLVESIASNRVFAYDDFVVVISYFAVAIGLLLIALGPIADRNQRLQPMRVFQSDSTRTIVIVGATATFLLFSLRTRPDVPHASQLILLGWMAILWSRSRYRRLGVAVGVTVFMLSLLVTLPTLTNDWTTASTRVQAGITGSLPRSQYVVYRYGEDIYLEEMVEAWHQYHAENPGATDVVFVANRSNSLTFVNAPLVYWLLDASPAHWLTTFDPGFADQEDQQRDMVEKLCESRALLVLREPFQNLEHPPDLRFSEILDEFISENYVAIHSNDRYDLLRLSDAGCGITSEM